MNQRTAKTTAAAPSGFSKVAAKQARDVVALYEPGKPARALLTDDQSPEEFFDALRDGGLDQEALTFLANALPIRETLWWGLRCLRDPLMPPPANDNVVPALAAVEAFTNEPGEPLRRAAQTAAEAATYETAAGCLALAVFLSQGSLAPADCPPVPVGPGFGAKTAAAALVLATLSPGVKSPLELGRRFLDIGAEVASSPAPWDPPPQAGAPMNAPKGTPKR